MKKSSFMLTGVLAIFFCLQASGVTPLGWIDPTLPPFVAPAQSSRIGADFGMMQLQFIPNQGQLDGSVDFYVRGRDKAIYFTPYGLTFVLAERPLGQMQNKIPNDPEGRVSQSGRRWVVQLDFMDADPDSKPVGLEKSSATISYFKGEPEAWKTGIPAYSKIV